VKWGLVAMWVLEAVVVVAVVGKPRGPVTPGLAALTVAINAAFITLTLAYWPA
jgi:hypothetical protein